MSKFQVMPTIQLGKPKKKSVFKKIDELIGITGPSAFQRAAKKQDKKLVEGTVPIGGSIKSIGKGTIKGVKYIGGPIKSIGKGTIKGVKSIAGSIGKSFLTSPLKTTLGVATIPTAVGVATTPQFRRFITGGFERGRELPGKIEDLIQSIPTIPSTITSQPVDLTPLITGLAGLGLGAGGTIATTKIIERLKMPASLDQPVAFQPLAPVQKPQQPAKPEKITSQKPINVKNTFNPTIDIKFSKSKRFINQQVNIK